MTMGGAPTSRLFRTLIPWREGASVDERFRADLVGGISLLFVVVSVFFCISTGLDAGANPRLPVLCGAAVFVFASNLVLIRRQSWSRMASWALSGEFVVLLCIAASFARGYRTYNSGWEMCIPLMVMFLLGVRNGAICALLLGVQALGFWWLEQRGLFIPFGAHVGSTDQSALVACGAMLLFIVGIGTVYERTHEARRAVLSATIEQLTVAHQALASANQKLIAGEKLSSLGMLAAGVAHEINNPMAYITSNVTALQRELRDLATDPALLKEYEDEVLPATLDGIQRVNAIVSDLRRFASGDPESFVEYDLNTEIAAAMRMAHGELHRRQTKTQLDLGVLPKVLGLPRQIMQVVMNLVVNAAQASDVGGTVKVSSWTKGDEVAIKVEDSGMGMSPEIIAKLFQPFFTTKPVGEGTGLGLAMAHGIVAAHGGRIDVESAAGCGSGFTITLPVVPPVRLAGPAGPPSNVH